MWGVLSELEELKRVPDTSGFQQLQPGDSLTFVSHAWNISLDPTSGVLHYCMRPATPVFVGLFPQPAHPRVPKRPACRADQALFRCGCDQCLQGAFIGRHPCSADGLFTCYLAKHAVGLRVQASSTR